MGRGFLGKGEVVGLKVSLGELTLVFGVGRGLGLVKLYEAGRVHLTAVSLSFNP